ncbi:hypothetical protein HOP50_01g03740 [Chloropicon primus]|uniref:Uncharacterized protein n=1 Tax=Chloropicon primus TaxID=1764295 RepID=A0A5B8MBS4_9CHLO|nr:hypothetical protein A3770_01p03860 [Chloropicon primus]UPQ97083.1 hypothetical protein HOP50_01g03740 [Chloropicon primus]|eukprot:QDZ17868.1 hypothetical protein A3770_01p03860 [Chloropicon primus]
MGGRSSDGGLEVDDLLACGELARKFEALHSKLLDYLGGVSRKGRKPTLGWTATQVLRRLALYTGGVTQPVLLTELQLSWLGGGKEGGTEVGGKRSLPVEVALKKSCPSDSTFYGYVTVEDAKAGDCNEGGVLPECIELRGAKRGLGESDEGSVPEEEGEGDGGGRGVRLILPLALKERLQRPNRLLDEGRLLTLGGCKALTVGKESFLSPTESVVVFVEAGREEDARYLAECLGVAVSLGEGGIHFEQAATGSLGGRVVVSGRVSKVGASSVTVEVSTSNEATIPAGEAELDLHGCHGAIPDLFESGDHVVLELPGVGKSSVVQHGSDSGGRAKVKCSRGSLFYKVKGTKSGGSISATKCGPELVTLEKIASGCRDAATVIGVVTQVRGVEKSQHFPSEYTCYEIGLKDEHGSAAVEVGFRGRWNAGLVEQGHMIALTGVTTKNAKDSSHVVCTWANTNGNTLFNLSGMYSRLHTTFEVPEESSPCSISSGVLRKSNKVTLRGFKNVAVRTLHKQCLRRVQNVVIDFFDDENDMECCTASTAAVTQTPETPNKSGGLFECSFCRTDCSADDVVLGYSGHVEVETDHGLVLASVDAPALRKIIQMEPVHYKRSARSGRTAHLSSLVGQDLWVLFYRSVQNAPRKRLLGETTATANADEGALCISVIEG